MANSYDVVVVGAGHNGLVCGAYLAKAGLKVAILERRGVLGGFAVTEQLWPGFKVSTASHVQALFQPKIIDDLDLTSRGFEMIPTHYTFIPFLDGRSLTIWGELSKTCEEIAKFSKRDAEVFPEFDAFRKDVAAFLRQLFWVTPPNPTSWRLRDLKTLFSVGSQLRRMGKKAFRFFDVMTMSIGDFLDEWFESDQLKAMISQIGSVGAFGGPRTPGSAYVVVHHAIGQGKGPRGWGFVRGGMGALSESIAKAARDYGATIRSNADVEKILVRLGRVSGIVLKGGEEIQARLVVSNADPKRTFLHLLERKELPTEFLKDIEHYKTYGTSFKVNVMLSEPPQYTAFDPKRMGNTHASYVHICSSMEYLEQAYDDAKYGRPSRRPFMSALVPSLVDDTLAPKGRHVFSVFGGHAPYKLRNGGWDQAAKEAFGDTVIETIAEYAPNVRSAVMQRQILTPVDFENVFGATEGHIFHGEMSLDQLFFMRPVPGYADYRTPVRGLYLCGSGVHPGGGVTGLPGYNAAREILKDRWQRLFQ